MHVYMVGDSCAILGRLVVKFPPLAGQILAVRCCCPGSVDDVSTIYYL